MKIKEFKSIIFAWLNEPKWLNRLALYLALGAALIWASHLAFSYLGFLHTDVDSARYMLSSLVQSEAAIVALVVTLSLVAVQLAAQSYSARVIEVFRRTPDLWILMGIYGIAIFYGLGVLKLIEKVNPQVNSLSNLEGQVAFSYYLGVFAFLALVPYIWKTLDLLKPSTVINMLAERITKQNILLSIEKKSDDPIQPLIDIVRGALMKFDFETLREGLWAIGDRTDYLLKNDIFINDEEVKISERIFNQLTKFGKLTASRKDEESTIEVLDVLLSNWGTTEMMELEKAWQKVGRSITDIGVYAAKQKLEIATWLATNYIGVFGEAAVREELLEESQQTTTFLNEILEVSREHKLEDAIRRAEEALKEIN